MMTNGKPEPVSSGSSSSSISSGSVFTETYTTQGAQSAFQGTTLSSISEENTGNDIPSSKPPKHNPYAIIGFGLAVGIAVLASIVATCSNKFSKTKRTLPYTTHQPYSVFKWSLAVGIVVASIAAIFTSPTIAVCLAVIAVCATALGLKQVNRVITGEYTDSTASQKPQKTKNGKTVRFNDKPTIHVLPELEVTNNHDTQPTADHNVATATPS